MRRPLLRLPLRHYPRQSRVPPNGMPPVAEIVCIVTFRQIVVATWRPIEVVNRQFIVNLAPEEPIALARQHFLAFSVAILPVICALVVGRKTEPLPGLANPKFAILPRLAYLPRYNAKSLLKLLVAGSAVCFRNVWKVKLEVAPQALVEVQLVGLTSPPYLARLLNLKRLFSLALSPVFIPK